MSQQYSVKLELAFDMNFKCFVLHFLYSSLHIDKVSVLCLDENPDLVNGVR